MQKENLTNILESILFVNGNAINKKDIIEKLNIEVKDFEASINILKEKYSSPSGIILQEFNDSYQFSSNSLYSAEVGIVLNPIRERALTKATLETLSIIAYKQPVTRLDIEEIRGVDSNYAISVLTEHNLIAVVGRKDAVGKPLLFGTTDEFLKRFNLKDITELPDQESLMERIKTINEESENSGLYKDYEIPTEEIVPLSIKQKLKIKDIDPDPVPADEFL